MPVYTHMDSVHCESKSLCKQLKAKSCEPAAVQGRLELLGAHVLPSKYERDACNPHMFLVCGSKCVVFESMF